MDLALAPWNLDLLLQPGVCQLDVWAKAAASPDGEVTSQKMLMIACDRGDYRGGRAGQDIG